MVLCAIWIKAGLHGGTAASVLISRLHAIKDRLVSTHRMLIGHLVFVSCMLSAFAWLVAMPAWVHADSACGPGQRMVGLRNAEGGPAGQPQQQVPVCAPDANQDNQLVAATPEIVLSPLNAAIVWANMADGTPVYFYSVLRISAVAAVDDAMTACRNSGALNCRAGVTAANGWLSVSRAGDASLFAAYGRRKQEADKAALARCAQEAVGCVVAESIRNHVK